jgi:hypothetical protein
MSEKTIIYLIEKENGKKMKITVPESWKVTFGPATKGGDRDRLGQRLKMPMALRFYESDTKQRAIFTDVVSFRDLSIPVEVETEDIQEKHGYTEVDGRRQATVFQARVKRWENPDELNEVPKIEAPRDPFMEGGDDD